MQLIAHRGLTDNNIKENTLNSFKNALNNNFDGIELDIRKTKDNKIVVLHDILINRTSNGNGLINNYNYNHLLKYNFGTKNKPAKIPLLSTIIKKIHNTIIFIELKEEFTSKELNDILIKNKSNIYYIFSFNHKYVDKLNLKYKKGIINYIFNSKIDITKYDFVLILEDIINVKKYNYLKKYNVEAVIYGINNNIDKEIIKKYNELKYII